MLVILACLCHNLMMKLSKKAISISVIVIVAMISCYLIGQRTSTTSQTGQNDDSYPLLAKRLFVENPNDFRINFSQLRTDFRAYFAKNDVRGSLYFEYLPTGSSVRINDNQQYRAASLIKLPVAMELFKADELKLTDIDKTLVLQPEWLNDRFGDLYKKGAGYELTQRNAARIMLTDSDNTALRAVLSVTETALETDDRALGSLDIEFSTTASDGIDIGARSYASFFKCLYFACYNTKPHSEEMLRYLTESIFDNRLVAGISDKNVKVAHKIGVFNTSVQSDCGIVYVEKNDYIICVMIEGDDTDATNNHIAELSKIAFDYITTTKE